MDDAIRDLLDALERAEAAGASLTDTVLREPLVEVILRGYVDLVEGYEVPHDLLLNYTEASERQNAPVIAAFTSFLPRATRWAHEQGLLLPEDRGAAFFGSEVSSTSGDTNVGTYFDSED